MKYIKFIPLITALLYLVAPLQSVSAEEKPNIWVISDICDPTDKRKGGHPKMDPDDIVSMASLLISANKFNIEKIVVGSRPGTIKDPIPFMNEVFVEAYKHDIIGMNKQFPGYQNSLDFTWSSLTRGEKGIQFSSDQSYADISKLTSINALKKYAKNNKVYVLSWGPMTEPAILVKHLMTIKDYTTLDNINIISHWTKSYLRSYVEGGGKKFPYRVSNCSGDASACEFLHTAAKKYSYVNLMELGAVGQIGLVDGTKGFEKLLDFENSRLGQILIRGKAYGMTPDQSDASTHWVLSGEFGINVKDFNWNGMLTENQEKDNKRKFYSNAPRMMNDLLKRSKSAKSIVYPKSFIGKHFSYVFRKRNQYSIYSPYYTSYQVFDKKDQFIQSGSIKYGHNNIDLPLKDQNHYRVKINYPQKILDFNL